MSIARPMKAITIQAPQRKSASTQPWLFSVKVFAAAMLALYVALALGLSRPYWAMATVYLVSSPLTAATRSKGLYRVAGTLLGAAAAVAMVPNLVNEPLLLMAAIALWTGAMLYLSLLERSPRSYVFLLAAYTLPIVALPAVTDPASIFDIALLRVEEIVIGIVSAGLVSALVFPATIAPVLREQSAAWLAHAATRTAEILTGPSDSVDQHDSRRRLTGDLHTMSNLMAQLAHEPGSSQTLELAAALRERMLALLPLLEALAGIIGALRAHPLGVPPALEDWMRDIAAWLHTPSQSPADRPRPAAALVGLHKTDHWHGQLIAAACHDLEALLDIWEAGRRLHRGIGHPESAANLSGSCNDRGQGNPEIRPAIQPAVHIDHGLLLIQAATAASATFLAGAAWMLSGWIDGAGAVSLAALTACFVSTVDVPRAAVRRVVIASMACLLLSCFYQFVVLPNATDFFSLATLLAVPYLCIGVLMARPDFGLTGVLLAVTTASFANVQQIYEANFADLFNSSLAACSAILFAAIWVVLARPAEMDFVARRILRASWKSIGDGFVPRRAAMSSQVSAQMRGQMLDRMTQLISIIPPRHNAPMNDGISELLVSFGALTLQRDFDALSSQCRRAIAYVLVELARYYRQCTRTDATLPPPARLAARVDAALMTLPDASDKIDEIDTLHGAQRDVLASLLAIRLALFPHSTSDSGAGHDVR
ncbi:FUSC family protein [Cupriavidus sp. RAF12]|uniref:FUSC family protein n=1 Tax=Cupriavidus sp. RAF12 TaxID=3233050 RepID=UPI003F8F7473